MCFDFYQKNHKINDVKIKIMMKYLKKFKKYFNLAFK